ncbi:hypothetical protein FGM00_16625 [Aggregatimonas sangjinii]|uniref:Polysaccharide lyase-like protein n=1 Tax=Aggregatimonas sangjinii TaxID=2583587 RepID=A0A5B7SSK5_9FLAO|nr:heparin lyase I family protein [Aggregatimonas sangjinii]QCX01656.1 hypothetical protein FGM00_16625 [Aggregatimonas sangjinii]
MIDLRPARWQINLLCLIGISLIMVLSCSKDAQIAAEQIETEKKSQVGEEKPPVAEVGNIDCGSGGGKADEAKAKIWCWDTITIPEYTEAKGVLFSNDELKTNSECYEKQVSIAGDRLKFTVNPTTPTPESWCGRSYNMRAEVSTAPFRIQHPQGTEEWFGWTYEFGPAYIADARTPWIMFQCHNGLVGEKPLISLWVTSGDGQFNTGEITLVNAANSSSSNQYYPTGVYPIAGQKLKIVAHVVWGDDTNGLVQIWIDDVKVHDVQSRTIQASAPYGGNAKWGIYKWKWANESSVVDSQEQGISVLETYMGTLRIVTRKPSDSQYGANAYTLVEPD